MKNTITLFLLLISFNIFAKEYSSIHNINLTIPENYFTINNLTVDEITEYEQETGNEIYNNYLIKNILDQLGDLKVDYLIPDYAFSQFKDDIVDNINIIAKEEIFETSDIEVECKELNNAFKTMFGDAYNQILCRNTNYINNTVYERRRISEIGLYVQQDQFTFYLNNGKKYAITLTCHKESCSKVEKDFINIIQSIKR